MHEPVLVSEVVEGLAMKRGSLVLDGTVGTGGHAEAILEASSPDGVLVGLDRDRLALAVARERLARFGGRARLHHALHAQAPAVLDRAGIGLLDGALLDLGASSLQFDTPERGFSFAADGPLDMRMDPSSPGPTAADLVNRLSERELADLIFRLGEERHSRRIARAIVASRGRLPLRRTLELAAAVARSVPGRGARSRIHPATRTFQALRIAVNREIEELEAGLPAVASRLRVGGRFAVISFHSLEDRRVKTFFRSEASAGRLRLLVRKPIRPAAPELARNPRSRSARLRLAEVVAA